MKLNSHSWRIKIEGGRNMSAEKCLHKNFTVIDKQEVYDVKGEKISVAAKVKKCADCGEEIFDFDLDTENLKSAYKNYKLKHNLMQAEEITALRKKFHLTQNMLALLVGCTQATIARYEKGSVQRDTHNTALMLLQNPDNIRKIFAEKIAEFSPSERQTLERVLEAENSVAAKSLDLLENLYNYSPDIYSGFKKFDVFKFMAVVLFFAKNQPNLYKTKLMKLLWYSDMLFFKENTLSMTGMKYLHFPYGPVPDKHSSCLSLLENLGVIELQEQETGEIVLPKVEKISDSDFSPSELKILQSVNEKFLFLKANELSSLSHKEIAYKKTSFAEPISYEFAFAM